MDACVAGSARNPPSRHAFALCLLLRSRSAWLDRKDTTETETGKARGVGWSGVGSAPPGRQTG